MALVQRNCLKLACNAKLATGIILRHSSTKSLENTIKKSVFISQSKDIYTNLALEDWLYRNFDFSKHHVLMLWQNDPCVVIGRHQNPWLEANLPELGNIGEGAKLARRNSGGGTVYHDLGNLNMTFFTPKEQYNRKYNLDVISRAVFRGFGVKLHLSSREDLTIRDSKVSGTAAKLGRPNSYHHCTLLVNSNKVDLSLALQKQPMDIATNATKSVKSRIMNLCEESPKLQVKDVLKAVGWEYLRTPALTLKDGGMELANKQQGFQMINPTEEWFPGITSLRNTLTSWDWCFGKTPNFQISRSFVVPDNLLKHQRFETNRDELKVTISVEKGHISDITLYIPHGLSANGYSGEAAVVSNLKGHKFSDDAMNYLEVLLGSMLNDKDKFVTECLKQVMTSA